MQTCVKRALPSCWFVGLALPPQRGVLTLGLQELVLGEASLGRVASASRPGRVLPDATREQLLHVAVAEMVLLLRMLGPMHADALTARCPRARRWITATRSTFPDCLMPVWRL